MLGGRISVGGSGVETLLLVDCKWIRRLEIQRVLAHGHVLELDGRIPLRLPGRRYAGVVLFVPLEFHLCLGGEVHGIVAHDEVSAPPVLQARLTHGALVVAPVQGVIPGHKRPDKVVLQERYIII